MSGTFTANLNLYRPEVGFDADVWGGTPGLNDDLTKLDAVFAAAGTGTSVGLNVTGKTLTINNATVGGNANFTGVINFANAINVTNTLSVDAATHAVKIFGSPGGNNLQVYDNVSSSKFFNVRTEAAPDLAQLGYWNGTTYVGTNMQGTWTCTSPSGSTDNGTRVANTAFVQAAVAAAVRAAVPPGVMMPFAGGSAPVGWLNCDGNALDRVTYAALFAIIGTTYGGSGSTFNLPDTRGRVIVAPGPGVTSRANALGAQFGSEVVGLTAANLPSHTHNVPISQQEVTHSGSGSSSFAMSSGGTITTDGGTGGGQAHENCQPSICLYYIIKY